MPTDQVRANFNSFVTRQIAKAQTLAEKLYWKGMYV